jgi:hypothetical protein
MRTIATISITLPLLFIHSAVYAQRPIGFCDGCWCIPEAGDACPSKSMPIIDFSDEWLYNLRTMEFLNLLEMDASCDIYNDTEGCDTTPPLEEGDACVAEIPSFQRVMQTELEDLF